MTVLFMHAQETTVKGQVIDADSTDPVSGVAVSIKGATLSQTTDAEGKFNFTNNLPLGEQSISCSERRVILLKRLLLLLKKEKL